MSRSDTITCRSCGHTIMAKGGDFTHWKSLVPRPNDATLWHYCPKNACQAALKGAIRTAAEAWGYELPPEADEEPEADEPLGII